MRERSSSSRKKGLPSAFVRIMRRAAAGRFSTLSRFSTSRRLSSR